MICEFYDTLMKTLNEDFRLYWVCYHPMMWIYLNPISYSCNFDSIFKKYVLHLMWMISNVLTSDEMMHHIVYVHNLFKSWISKIHHFFCNRNWLFGLKLWRQMQSWFHLFFVQKTFISFNIWMLIVSLLWKHPLISFLLR